MGGGEGGKWVDIVMDRVLAWDVMDNTRVIFYMCVCCGFRLVFLGVWFKQHH